MTATETPLAVECNGDLTVTLASGDRRKLLTLDAATRDRLNANAPTLYAAVATLLWRLAQPEYETQMDVLDKDPDAVATAVLLNEVLSAIAGTTDRPLLPLMG